MSTHNVFNQEQYLCPSTDTDFTSSSLRSSVGPLEAWGTSSPPCLSSFLFCSSRKQLFTVYKSIGLSREEKTSQNTVLSQEELARPCGRQCSSGEQTAEEVVASTLEENWLAGESQNCYGTLTLSGKGELGRHRVPCMCCAEYETETP